MITYIFGKPGSGKSYKAITIILEELKTRPVYSNIELKKYLAGYNYLHQDMMSSWLGFIEHLYVKSQDELIPEEVIYKELRNRGISDCSIFIDEAHIYGFNNLKKKDFLLFFLALQRHVNLNIFLITQTRKQLHSVFHDFGDTVISSVSATERLIASVLEYRYFSHVDMIRDTSSAFKNEKIIPKKEIFELYTSGDKNTGDDGFRKKLKFLIIGIVIVSIFLIRQFYSLIHSGPDDLNDLHNSNEISVTNDTNISSLSPIKNNIYVSLICVNDECKNSILKINVSLDDLQSVVLDSNSRFLSVKRHSSSLSVVNLLASEEFIKLFQGANNEKNKFNKKNYNM